MTMVSLSTRLACDRLRESIELKQSMLSNDELLGVLDEAAQACIKCLASGGKLLLFGNGGSAADAQHIAAELVGRYLLSRGALAAVALTTNMSSITAIANDYSYDEVFSRQLEALGNEGDVAIGLSTSGESPNVIAALSTARKKGLTTIGITGGNGGHLRYLVDYCLCVPSSSTPRIQEAHMWLGHTLCEIIELHFHHECDIP